MPNGFHGTKEEWDKMEKDLLDSDNDLILFAKEKGMEISKNYHNWPSRALRWEKNDINKDIGISLVDSKSQTYNMGVGVFKDIDFKRYWKNKILKEKVSWQEIKNNLISLLEEGYKLAESWEEKDLEYSGEISRPDETGLIGAFRRIFRDIKNKRQVRW
jgi:hypothetical protein